MIRLRELRVLLVLVAVVLMAGAVALGRETGDYRLWVRLAIAFEVGGGMLVLAAAWAWQNVLVGRVWLLAVAVVGIALRLAVFPATWELSDDAARYHWDGKAIAHGVNPFIHAPDDPTVAWIGVDEVDGRINHPWNRTCYPPLAQGLFTVGYLLSPGNLRGLQWLNLAAEIFAWFILARELERRRRTFAWLLLMIWSPLLVCQGYLPGHLDLLTLPLVALLACAVLARQSGRAGLWLAAACLVKPLPLLILPAIVREFGLRQSLRLLGVFGLVVAASYVPFLQAGPKLFTSTWLMATDWSFNGSVAAGLESLLSIGEAHLAAGILTGLGVLVAAWRGRDFLERALGAYLVFVIFTPTLFPWYVVSALPLLVLRPGPGMGPALLGLGVLVPLADQVVIAHQLRGVWREAAWVRWAQYLPFYGLLAWEIFSNRILPGRRQAPDA
jgi:alpha-1,6-mannosyltransferase